jgi:putative hydrolase of the HAD superfamily
MALKLILCDLGNVLIRFDHRIAVKKILAHTSKTFDQAYSIFFDSPLTKDFEEGKISSEIFFKELTAKLDLRNLTFKDFVPLWNDIFFDNPGIEALLLALRRRYHLHMISNINVLHHAYLCETYPKIFNFFDKVYLSYEVGCCKPDVAIYKRAVLECGYQFDETLYTDDRADLIEEARKIGIPSVLFKGVKDLKKELEKKNIL